MNIEIFIFNSVKIWKLHIINRESPDSIQSAGQSKAHLQKNTRLFVIELKSSCYRVAQVAANGPRNSLKPILFKITKWIYRSTYAWGL